MDPVVGAIKKTKLGLTIEEHLQWIKNWRPKSSYDSTVINGNNYEYDGSNLKVHLKARKTFQLLEIKHLGKLKVRTILSDGENQVEGEFFQKPNQLSHNKRLTQDVEGQVVQISEFTIVISFDDLPILLSTQDFTVVGKLDLGARKFGSPVPVEGHSVVPDLIQHIKGNLPSTPFRDADHLHILSQASMKQEDYNDNDSRPGERERSEADADASNVSQLPFSTQVPLDLRPIVDRKAEQTRKAATGLQGLLKQLQGNKASTNSRTNPVKEGSRAQSNRQYSSTKTLSSNHPDNLDFLQRSGLTTDPRKDLTPIFKDMRADVQAESRQDSEKGKLNGERQSGIEEDEERPVKRPRRQDLVTSQDVAKGPDALVSSQRPISRNEEGEDPKRLDTRNVAIPKDQERLLEDEAWIPPLPGKRTPECHLPNELWTSFNAVVERRLEHDSGSEADSESSDYESASDAPDTKPSGGSRAGSKSRVSPSKGKQDIQPPASPESGDESDAISWEPTPSQKLRRPALPPDSSAEQPSPSASRFRNAANEAEWAVTRTETSNIIDMEGEDSDIEISEPKPLLDTIQAKLPQNGVTAIKAVEDKSVLVNRTPVGSGEASIPPDSAEESASFSAPGNNQDFVLSSTRPTIARRAYHPLIANPIQNTSALYEQKHGALLPESGQLPPDDSEDNDEMEDVDNANAITVEGDGLDRSAPETSPTFDILSRGVSVDPAHAAKTDEAASLVRQSPVDEDGRAISKDTASRKTGMHYKVEEADHDVVLSDDESVARNWNSGGRLEDECIQDKRVFEAQDEPQSSPAGRNGDLGASEDRVSVVDQHHQFSQARSAPPGSDEDDDMADQQLQSDMYKYCSQAPGTLEHLTPPKTTFPAVQVPASSPRHDRSSAVDLSEDEGTGGNVAKGPEHHNNVSDVHETQESRSSLDLDSIARKNRRDFMTRIIASRNMSIAPPQTDANLLSLPKSPSAIHDAAVASKPPQMDFSNLIILAQTALKRSKPPETYLDMVYRRFKEEYRSSYDADQTHFLNLCKKIKKLTDTGTFAPHPSMWDDFIIRHRVEYRQYMSDCADTADDPIPYELFYNVNIPEPLHTKRIITPAVLGELVGVDPDTPSQPRSVNTPASFSRPPSRLPPNLQHEMSNSTRRSSFLSALNAPENRSESSSHRPSRLTPARYQMTTVELVDLIVDTPEVRSRDVTYAAAIDDEDVMQGMSEDHVKDESDSATRRTWSAKNRTLEPSARLRRKPLGEHLSDSRISIPSAPKIIDEAVVPEHAVRPESDTPEEYGHDNTSRTPNVEITTSSSAVVKNWLSSTQHEAQSVPKTKSKALGSSATKPKSGSISPPPRLHGKRRSLPWSTSKNDRPSDTNHSQTSAQNHPRFQATALSAKAPNTSLPNNINNLKRKRVTDSEVEVPQQALRLKSSKKIKEEAQSKWFADPNTPYNQYARSYLNLKTERERHSLMNAAKETMEREDRGRLMTGGVNILGWMKS